MSEPKPSRRSPNPITLLVRGRRGRKRQFRRYSPHEGSHYSIWYAMDDPDAQGEVVEV